MHMIFMIDFHISGLNVWIWVKQYMRSIYKVAKKRHASKIPRQFYCDYQLKKTKKTKTSET